MKYKDRVVSNLDAISNQLTSIRNLIDNNNLNKDQLLSELDRLIKRVDDVNEMISLEDSDFATLRYGAQ